MSLIDTTIALLKKSGIRVVELLGETEDEKATAMLAAGLLKLLQATTDEQSGGGPGFGKNLNRSKRLLRLLREASTLVEERLDREAAEYKARAQRTVP